MTTQTDWTYDGSLDQATPTTPDQERAKVAALFGKGDPAPSPATEGIDYQAEFQKLKAGDKHQASQEMFKVPPTVTLSPTLDQDPATLYKDHLQKQLASHEADMSSYQQELDHLQGLVNEKGNTIKTITAILKAMDTLV
ncbi:DUF5945 family protein [Streptococcus acidominimus]|uniref:Glutamate-cysteine ligase n=1 Tax=Streptococcus acidominimus TaxID=1326 RepID=A0A1Q8E7L8_STRAI|nr:DUF5945 family protein [Streptococcus acidominimus]OLF47792.1 hypothetical protein BU200_10010 [Streptococcus acidominimus]SUN08028.1 glutamate-cysteine ligase [Streptococcus acidominimus]